MCLVEGCIGKIQCRGYCNKHYRQITKYGMLLNQIIKIPNICSVDGCNALVNCNGFCQKHYVQIKKYGRIVRTVNDPNEIVIEDNIAIMYLYDADCEEIATTIFDTQFIEFISNYKWSLHNTGYVVAGYRDENDVRHQMLLHRAIMYLSNGFSIDDNLQVDHEDTNKLNNLRNNLRMCTGSQNEMNKDKSPGQYSSIYKGVTWHIPTQKWRASIKFNGKRLYLGNFDDEIDAARSYNFAAIKYHKEFARLNIIPEEIDFKVAVNM